MARCPPSWNPIETAPKDGGDPLLFLVPAGLMSGIDVAVQVEWRDGRWTASGFEEMPYLRRAIDEAIGWKPR